MAVAESIGFDLAARQDVPTCPLCGVANASTPTTDRYGCRVGVSRCACGFVYLNPRLSAEDYAVFYQHWYRRLVGALDGRDPAMIPDAAKQRAYGQRLAHACPQIPAGGQLLDVGGSTGAVAEGWNDLQHPPAKVTVLDPCEAEVNQARARGFTGIVGTLETWTPPARLFDLAFCIQTIDHLCDPLAGLRTIRQTMRRHGWFVVDYLRGTVAVPPSAILTTRGLRVREPLPVKLDHPCYWTRRTLTRALTESGWTVARFLRTGTKGLLVCRAA